MKKLIVNTKAEARQVAIAWQQWSSERSSSYYSLSKWQDYFTKLAKKFHLVREFKENGII